MALAITNPTLVDVQKRLDPNGQIANVVEILNQDNGPMEDWTWVEANDTTSHRTTIRTGLPQPTWRKLYQSVAPTKSTTTQVTDTMGTMQMYSEIDTDLADLNGNSAEWMLTEQMAFYEALKQEAVRTLIYGDEAKASAKFTGLNARYSTKTISNAANAFNVLDAGGSADGTGYMQSAWLCNWSPVTAHMIYPKGKPTGLDYKNLGEVTTEVQDSGATSLGKMQVYRSMYKWTMGFSLRDWRFVSRVCNISVKSSGSNSIMVAANTTARSTLITSMIQAAERQPDLSTGRRVWYVSRAVREALRLAILEKTSYNLSWENVSGMRVMMFDGIEVKRTDALTGLDADGTTVLEPVVS
jgi:hypothetical protein